MSVSISNDCENWREVSEDELCELLLKNVDCWVDLSTADSVCHVTLNTIRKWRECQGPLPWTKAKRATELYGIPIVYEDGK